MARLHAADASAFERTAELEGVEKVTLRRMLERWVEHDVEHLREMEQLWRASASATALKAAASLPHSKG